MNISQGPDPFGLGPKRKVSRRHWLIVPGLATLSLLAAAGYAAIAPQVYTATATVDVTPSGQGIVLIPALIPDRHSQAQAARSIGVAAIAGPMMHSSLSPQALAKKVTVTAPPKSFFLHIACADRSANRAATCANDFAKAYLQSSGRRLANLLDAQANTLRRAVTSLSQTGATLRVKAAALPPNSPRRAADDVQLTRDHRQLRSFAQQLASVTGGLTNFSSGSIVTLATAPGKPGGSGPLPVLLSGLVAGLLAGVIAALLLGRRNTHIHGTQVT